VSNDIQIGRLVRIVLGQNSKVTWLVTDGLTGANREFQGDNSPTLELVSSGKDDALAYARELLASRDDPEGVRIWDEHSQDVTENQDLLDRERYVGSLSMGRSSAAELSKNSLESMMRTVVAVWALWMEQLLRLETIEARKKAMERIILDNPLTVVRYALAAYVLPWSKATPEGPFDNEEWNLVHSATMAYLETIDGQFEARKVDVGVRPVVFSSNSDGDGSLDAQGR